MDSEEEINLTLADIGDSTAFEELYADFDLKKRINLHPDFLKKLCRLWYGRGIARGTEWMQSELDRLVEPLENDC